VASGSGGYGVAEYRVYTVGGDGHFIGFVLAHNIVQTGSPHVPTLNLFASSSRQMPVARLLYVFGRCCDASGAVKIGRWIHRSSGGNRKHRHWRWHARL